MAIHKGLKTKDALKNRNISNNSGCILCSCNQESSLHLLIECSFSKQIWLYIAAKFGTPTASTNVMKDLMLDFINGCDESKEDNLTLSKLCFSSFT